MRTSSRTAGMERLLQLVSPRVGVITSLTRLTKGAEEPTPPYIFQATLSYFDFRKRPDMERIGIGKGETESEAMSGAIGEAIEHYCAFQPDPGRLFRTSYAALAPQAIHPARFVLFSERQYDRAGF